MFSKIGSQFYITTNSIQGLQFLDILPKTLFLKKNSHFNRCKVISYIGFDFYFPNN